MPKKTSSSKSREKDTVTYDEFKEHEGQRYTGMKIGRTHSWHYDQGSWKEKKITPDLWQIAFDVTKRRKGRAPEGSGVPVGTEYHWYILAHQNTRKVNANDYATSMTGLKFKVAHKRAGSEKWSATPKTQRKRMIKFLQDVIADLEREPVVEPESKEPAKKTAPRKTSRRKLKTPPSMMKKRASRSRRRHLR